MRIILLITAFALNCACFIKAQEVRVFTLAKTIELASENSLESFRVKNLYRSNYWSYRTYRAERLPGLSLNMTPISYNRQFVQRYDYEQNIDVFKDQSTINSYGRLSLSQNVDFTGGTIYIDSEIGYLRNFGATKLSQFSTVPVRIGYYQSLFGFNQFKWDRKIEPLKFEIAKREFLVNMESISKSATQYFFSLVLAQRIYDIEMTTLRTNEQMYGIGLERQKIAAITKADLLTLKLDVVNAGNSVKAAEAELKKCRFDFASYIGIDPENDIRVMIPGAPQLLNISYERAKEQASINNPTLQDLQKQLMTSEMNLEKVRREALFSAKLSASVGFNQVGPNLASAYHSPLRQDLVSVSLSLPLIDWGIRKGKYNMANNLLKATEISVEQSRVAFYQNVMTACDDLEMLMKQISSASEAMDLSEMAYEDTKQRFVIGKVDVNALSIAQSRMTTAQKNYITILRSYWLSYFELRKLTLFDFENNVPLSVDFDLIHGL